ncbi:DUF4367 domain-containing protein [Paenibacillus paeoniae]|uniref:DUF4367 domain-containing protein n=1 Tax=Paenibacillus paeoniae TaxID=2292705 RepID=A0A371P6U3_9BACL|nr:DUF4367 domain-containing protein [Paenibacillus paeoniae]REK71248.1 DUF4367 domain-containing protein [Paenibacillus paeoniae]
MNKEEFDQLFDKAFDESVQKHPFTPSPELSWERLQKQLAKRKRRKSQLRALPYVAASFLLGAFLFGTPTASNAFQPLFQAVVTIKDDVVRIVFGQPNSSKTVPKTPPPPGYIETNSTTHSNEGDLSAVTKFDRFTYSTWEEASQYMDFRTPTITYIADGYQLHDISAYFNVNQSTSIAVITYTDKEGIVYTITFKRLMENSVFQSGGGSSVHVETLKMGTMDTYIFTTNDGYIAQEFLIDDIHISVSGPLSREETLIISKEIIESMTK